MAYTRSPRDILSELSSQIKRDLSDIYIDYLGTETQILRIELGEMDVLGDRDETLITNIISNVIIKHPMGNNQWLFSSNDSNGNAQVDSVDLWEILPITMKIKYSADYNTEPVAMQKGDMIVELLQDENQNNIPVIMQVTKLKGGFEGKFLYQKDYELALYRGEIPHDIQNAIDNFISGIEMQTISVVTPTITTNITYNETLNIIDSYKAGQNLLAYRIVIIDNDNLVYYADSSNLTHVNKVIGITLVSINKGGNVRIQTFGEIRESAWEWNTLLSLFLSTEGQILQVSPEIGFSLEVGRPLTPDALFLNIQQPIILS
jgi:hypothetical protein